MFKNQLRFVVLMIMSITIFTFAVGQYIQNDISILYRSISFMKAEKQSEPQSKVIKQKADKGSNVFDLHSIAKNSLLQGITELNSKILHTPVQQTDIAPYLLTQPITMFSIPFGSQANQISVNYTPKVPENYIGDTEIGNNVGDYAIAPDGSLYIIDGGNKKIKHFNTNGVLVNQFDSKSAVYKTRSRIGINSTGKVYVVSPEYEFEVFNADGIMQETETNMMTQAYSALKNSGFNADYKPLMTTNGDIIIHEQNHPNSFYIWVNPIWVHISGIKFINNNYWIDGKRPTNMQTAQTLLIDHDDNVISTNSYCIYDKSDIKIYNSEGILDHTITLPNGDFSTAEAIVPLPPQIIVCSNNGHFFVKRSPMTIKRIPLGANIADNIYSYSALLEYDSNGNFVGVRAKMNRVNDHELPPKVDTQGNVYWLEFKSDHVEVMKAPAPSP